MINEENYYSVNNKGLSQSKIKMYEKDPNYMYRACISGELGKKDSKAFVVGREVDSLLTEMDKRTNVIIAPYKDFRGKEAREWRDEQIVIGKTVIKEDEYENIMAIAIAVQRTSVWKFIEKNFTMQEILIKKVKIGKHFDFLYGKPDAYRIDENGVCWLLDLKTSITVDRRKFMFRAIELGYLKQLYFYSKLLKYKYPQIKSFNFGFIVAEKSEPYRVVGFNITNQQVYVYEEEMEKTIDSIAKRTDWTKPDLTFDDFIPLFEPTTSELFESLTDDIDPESDNGEF